MGTPQPLADAMTSLGARTPVGSVLRSADWANVPLALRESAFFAAAVESARLTEEMRNGLLELVSLQRRRMSDGSEGAYLSRARFIQEMRDLALKLGVDTRRDESDTGTLADITSEGRLGLIFDIQTQRASEYARWKAEQDADVLDAYPAQELVRIEDRMEPRDWQRRWVAKGGRLLEGGRMVALKSDPIWTKISRFGTPWPPFDFQSGMGLEDVSREEAEELGLLGPDDLVLPQDADFTQDMQASARNLTPRTRTALQTIFGDQVEFDGDTVRWVGNKQPERSDEEQRVQTERDRATARSVFRRSQAAFESSRSRDRGAPVPEALQAGVDRPWGAEIGAVANGRKALFHEGPIDPLEAEALAEALREAFNPGTTGLAVEARDGHLYVYRPGILTSIDEAHRLSVEGENGLLLGYGSKSMFEPGNVTVHLVDERGEIIGGFRTRPDTAQQVARERARDYADAWGERIIAEVVE